jgi:hypothetical protein
MMNNIYYNVFIIKRLRKSKTAFIFIQLLNLKNQIA